MTGVEEVFAGYAGQPAESPCGYWRGFHRDFVVILISGFVYFRSDGLCGYCIARNAAE